MKFLIDASNDPVTLMVGVVFLICVAVVIAAVFTEPPIDTDL
jgi:hypothetical protein